MWGSGASHSAAWPDRTPRASHQASSGTSSTSLLKGRSALPLPRAADLFPALSWVSADDSPPRRAHGLPGRGPCPEAQRPAHRRCHRALLTTGPTPVKPATPRAPSHRSQQRPNRHGVCGRPGLAGRHALLHSAERKHVTQIPSTTPCQVPQASRACCPQRRSSCSRAWLCPLPAPCWSPTPSSQADASWLLSSFSAASS